MPEATTPRSPAASVRRTTEDDLPFLERLWNDGAVMSFVGFPDGLGVDAAHLRAWWAALRSDPLRRHLVVETADLGPCGEAHYRARPDGGTASVDVKLLPVARGRGLATLALSAALDELFGRDLADGAGVDPHRDNVAALRLYERLGFRPERWATGHAEDDAHVLLRLDRATWLARGGDAPVGGTALPGTVHGPRTFQQTVPDGGGPRTGTSSRSGNLLSD